MDEESYLRLKRRSTVWTLPAARNLNDDVVGVFRKRERDSLSGNGQWIVARRRFLSRQRLRCRRRPRRRFAACLILSRRRGRARDGALRTLRGGNRRRFFLRRTLERLR